MGNFAIKTLKTFVSLSVIVLEVYECLYTLGSGKDGLAGVSTFSEFEFKSDLTSLMIQTARFFVDSQLQNHISYDANSLLICTFYSSMSFGRNIKQLDPLTKRGPRMSIIIRNFVDKKSGSSICKHSLGIHFWTCIITFSFDTFVLRYYRSIYSYIFLYIYICYGQIFK